MGGRALCDGELSGRSDEMEAEWSGGARPDGKVGQNETAKRAEEAERALSSWRYASSRIRVMIDKRELLPVPLILIRSKHMKFHIKVPKSIFVALGVSLVLFFYATWPAMKVGEFSALLPALGKDVMILLLVALAVYVLLLSRRKDRLSIDDDGIRFDSHVWTRRSWSVAWCDIQLPIIHDFLANNVLYIQLHCPDSHSPQSKNSERGILGKLLSFRIIRVPDNPVFALEMVRMWRADDEYVDKITGERPTVIREIERHLGQGAVKKALILPLTLDEQVRKTRRNRRTLQERAYDLDSVANGVFAGAIFLFLLGLSPMLFGASFPYLLNESLTPYRLIALMIAVITLWLLRRRKNAWRTSAVVALFFGAAFGSAVFNGDQFWAGNWGRQESRSFVLQAPKTPNQKSNAMQVWQSNGGASEEKNAGESETAPPPLKLEISADLARQPHQPGDRIELPVRRSLFGQYVLNIEEAGGYFKKRSDK